MFKGEHLTKPERCVIFGQIRRHRREYKKEDAETDKKKATEVKEKEDSEARKTKEEKRQNELEEARKAVELQEKEEQAHLDADEAIKRR